MASTKLDSTNATFEQIPNLLASLVAEQKVTNHLLGVLTRGLSDTKASEDLPPETLASPPAEPRKRRPAIQQVDSKTVSDTLVQIASQHGRAKALELLARFDAKGFPQLPVEKYADFMTAAAELQNRAA
jgi:hypothetical protein